MSDLGIRDMHSIIVCPVCAKNGDGRGILQSYYRAGELYCLFCAFCGWKGNYGTAQSYSFPCRIYQIVEIDLSVVENLFSMAKQLDKRVELVLPHCTKPGEVFEYDFFNKPAKELCSYFQWDLEFALRHLVATGWLFPAAYKVTVDG